MKKMKKFLSLVMSLVMVVSLFAGIDITSVAEASKLMCDADGDGYTTSADARLVLRYAAKLESEPEDISNIDVVSDGDIMASDARKILLCSMIGDTVPDAAPIRTSLDLDRSQSATKLVVSNSLGFVGHEIEVVISAESIAGTQNANLFIEYDPDMLEFVAINNYSFYDTDLDEHVWIEHGVLGYAFLAKKIITSDSAELIGIRFKVLDDCNTTIKVNVGTWDGCDAPADVEYSFDLYEECPHENTTEHPEEAPTCTENGYTAGVYCDDCEEWISGHDWISYGHDDYDEDGICDNCSETLSYIRLTSDKTEINPGEEFKVTVSVDNAQGLKEGSVSFAESWADETEYEIVSYEFNENLTFEETDSYNYDFSFDEAVQSDSVDIVTVTYKPLVIDKLYLYFNVYTSDLVMYENNEYIWIYTLCPHKNTTEHPEEAPTCTEGGYTAGVYCNDCDEWVSGHDWVHSWGHVDYDDDNICDNCMNSFSYIKLTSDKTEINPGEEFTITVSVDNAKGLKEGSVNFAYSWADETKYEIVSYEFNENLTFEETDSYYYDFSFNEAVQSDSVDIVTVTYKPLVIDKLLSLGFDVYTSDLVMYGNYEYIWIEMLCPHENTTEHPEEAPTCTEDGYTAGVYCDDCGEWISGHEWINSLGGHVDENEDNICDVCDEHYRLLVGENIIPNTDSNYSFYFKPEKNGYYKIKVDDGISVSGHELDENNEASFCLEYGEYLYLNTENYVGDDFSVTITLLEEVKTGHADADFDEFCDNCSEEIYSIMDLYCVVAEDETCEITGYELSFFEKNGLPITGDWYDTAYTEIYKYYYDYDVQKSFLVTSIAEGAFVGLNSMKTITIPASVTSIGDYAIGYKEKNDDAKIEGFIIYGYPGTVAEEYAKENGFEFVAIVEYEIENGEAIITAVAEGFASDYIPAEIAGYPVTTIGENCFADCGLRYLHLPENITTIKAGAFKNNPELGNYSFVIYGTLKTIEDSAFEGCGQIRIDYYGTPEQWNAISIGENNDAFRNAEVTFYGTGHKDFGYVIENGSVRIDYVNYDADFENLVVPETLDGYPVTDLNIGSQEDSEYFGNDYYHQITIPSSVTYISSFSVGYYDDWETGELLLVPDFKIIGVPGSYAETYAKENGITFEALPEVPEEHMHVDADFDEVCDICSASGYLIMDFILEFEGETCKITGYELIFIENGGTPIIGDVISPYYTNVWEYFYDSATDMVVRVTSIAEGACIGLDAMKEIIIPASVTSIGDYAIGYTAKSDDAKIEGFVICGYPGTVAEEYANENGITFEALSEVPDEPTTEEPTTEEPTTEEPTTEEPTTEEPTTEAPTTEPTTKEPVTDVPTTEKPSEKPSERPSTDGPATDGPDEKPVSDKLEVSGDTVKVDNTSKISTVKIKSSAEDILKSIKNEKVSVVDKNGKAVTGKTLVGTGSKIQIKDNSGKVISTYTVCVPNDVDGNGKTTAADARLALRGSARLEKIEGVYAQASDVTGDGKITAADARKLLRISAGLE